MTDELTILDTLEASLLSIIQGIKAADGYYYDWKHGNDDDQAIQSYPNASIVIDEENNAYDADAAGSFSYSNDINIRIISRVAIPLESENPNYSINTYFNRIDHDLKKIFGQKTNIMALYANGAHRFTYKKSKRILEKKGDRFVPGRHESEWILSYCQSSIDPRVVAAGGV